MFKRIYGWYYDIVLHEDREQKVATKHHLEIMENYFNRKNILG